MCGRYALDVTGEEIAVAFRAGLGSAAAWQPSWNIAPTRRVPVVRHGRAGLQVDLLRWGLVPAWADDAGMGGRLINARCETVREKPAYRESFRRRRCLVPIRAFYEWHREGRSPARPVAVRGDGAGLLGLAGLWASWHSAEGESLETFTILTTAAGPWLRAVHDRMPVVLRTEDATVWLDHRTAEAGGPDEERLAMVLAAATDGGLVMEPVSIRVNRVGNDGPDLLEVIEEGARTPRQGGLFGGDFED